MQGRTWPDQTAEPGTQDVLYRARNDGSFEDVTAAAGIREEGWGGGCATGDFDNDGWTDLYVTNHGPNVLWRNRGDGSFEDVSTSARVADPRWGASAAFVDLDSDGLLDLFVTNYAAFDWKNPPRNGGSNFCTWHGTGVFCGPRGLRLERSLYYRNRGDGSFEDATVAAGFAAAPGTYGLGVVPLDYDLDGRMDLYVANDATPNQLWRNLGEGRFQDVALRLGCAVNDSGREQAGMGVDAGDYDGDGRPDVFVTNFSEDWYTLYRNDEDGFSDVSMPTGIAPPTFIPLGWGTRFWDFDDDGDLDLVAANGHVYPQVEKIDTSPPIAYRQRANLLRNDGGRFTDVAEQAGPAWQAAYSARGLALADHDNDGRLDVLLVNIDERPALLRNSGVPGHHWLGIELQGRESNRDGFGSRLTLRPAGRPSQVRWASSAGSFQSGGDPRVHFGLGDAAAADLEIVWPSGRATRLSRIALDRYHRIDEADATEN